MTTKKRQEIIRKTLRKVFGGTATTMQIADLLDWNRNGVAQTLGSMRDVIGDVRPGSQRRWRLLLICEHCQSDHHPKDMEPLSSGDPSKCCRGCWAEYKGLHQRRQEGFQEEWVQDRRDEEEAGCFEAGGDGEAVRKRARELKRMRERERIEI